MVEWEKVYAHSDEIYEDFPRAYLQMGTHEEQFSRDSLSMLRDSDCGLDSGWSRALDEGVEWGDTWLTNLLFPAVN